MNVAEVKTIVQETYGEIYDDLVEDIENVINSALRTYNKYDPKVVVEELNAFTGQGLSKVYSSPYPAWVTVSHTGMIADKFIWQAQPMYAYDRTTGTLRINTIGAFVVRAIYNKTLDDITDEDELFFRLVEARCLIASGNRRKAFRITELPIENDGAERVSDGKEMWDKTIEELRDNVPMHVLVH